MSAATKPIERPPVVEMTVEEWRAEGERRFGPRMQAWRFVCPICGGTQSGDDFLALPEADRPKEISNVVYFSCIGRYLPDAPEAFRSRPKRGRKIGPEATPETHCNYTLGGLFCVARLVVISDGHRVPAFQFAEPSVGSAA